MNKNGQVLGTGTMYLIYFLMIVIITGGIYGGIISFFGRELDMRDIDANSLMNSIKRCINEQKLIEFVFKEGDAFFQKCHIDKEALESNNYLILINNSKGEEFFSGVYDYKIKCGFNERFKKIELPLCHTFCIEKDEICILTSSAQISKRVAA